jgi:hypothetical protein
MKASAPPAPPVCVISEFYFNLRNEGKAQAGLYPAKKRGGGMVIPPPHNLREVQFLI